MADSWVKMRLAVLFQSLLCHLLNIAVKLNMWNSIENEVMPQKCCSWQRLPKLNMCFLVANVLADLMRFDQNLTNYSENNVTVIDLPYIFVKWMEHFIPSIVWSLLLEFFFCWYFWPWKKWKKCFLFFLSSIFQKDDEPYFVFKLKKKLTTNIQSLSYLGIFLLQSYWQ